MTLVRHVGSPRTNARTSIGVLAIAVAAACASKPPAPPEPPPRSSVATPAPSGRPPSASGQGSLDAGTDASVEDSEIAYGVSDTSDIPPDVHRYTMPHRPPPKALPELTTQAVRKQRRMRLGRVGKVNVHVAYGAIADRDYAKPLAGRPNALLISYFADDYDPDPRSPTNLGDAVLGKLEKRDSEALEALFARAKVTDDVVRLAVNPRPEFPIGTVYTVVFEKGDGAEQKGTKIEAALEKVLVQAKAAGTKNVIVPALSVCMTCDHRLPMRALYRRIFRVLGSTSYAGDVQLDLYSGWPDDELAMAVRELRESWEELGIP